MTVYVKGQLVYGTEPASLPVELLTARSAAAVAAGEVFGVSLLQNPVPGNEVTVLVSGAAGQRLDIVLTDITGRVLSARKVSSASLSEKQQFLLPGSVSGVYFIKVNKGRETKTVRVIKL